MGRKQDSFDIQNVYESAVVLHQQGDFTRAINLYTQVLHHFPGVAGVHYNTGLAWYELEKFSKAIESYQRASELNPLDPDILYNLGLAYKMNKQYEEAEQAYLQALELAEDDQDILYNLGCCYQDAGVIEHACIIFEQLLENRPDHLPALNNLAYLHHLQEHFDRARELYGKVLELDPDRQSAQFMHAILSGENTQYPPVEYVRELFDQYSQNFEENLIKDLEYNTYCILRQAIENLPGSKKMFDHGLDLGCGTGLVGEAFHPVCTKLTGVDISQNMLDQAAEKKLYTYLCCSDIMKFLKHNDQCYDLFVAADVLPYLGRIDPLFAAVGHCVTDDALFCLSSEETCEPEWELQFTGRYAHNPDHIARVAAKNGWDVLERFPANIRKENDSWIKGTIFVFGRKR